MEIEKTNIPETLSPYKTFMNTSTKLKSLLRERMNLIKNKETDKSKYTANSKLMFSSLLKIKQTHRDSQKVRNKNKFENFINKISKGYSFQSFNHQQRKIKIGSVNEFKRRSFVSKAKHSKTDQE